MNVPSDLAVDLEVITIYGTLEFYSNDLKQ